MRLVLLFLFVAIAARSQPVDSANAGCIKQLEIPAYPRLADMARVAATVRSVVRVGADGVIDNVDSQVDRDSEPTKTLFRTAVEQSLRSSQFFPACKGHAVTLIFQFSLGEQTGNERVRFSYPNKFTIVSPAKIVQP